MDRTKGSPGLPRNRPFRVSQLLPDARTQCRHRPRISRSLHRIASPLYRRDDQTHGRLWCEEFRVETGCRDSVQHKLGQEAGQYRLARWLQDLLQVGGFVTKLYCPEIASLTRRVARDTRIGNKVVATYPGLLTEFRWKTRAPGESLTTVFFCAQTRS